MKKNKQQIGTRIAPEFMDFLDEQQAKGTPKARTIETALSLLREQKRKEYPPPRSTAPVHKHQPLP